HAEDLVHDAPGSLEDLGALHAHHRAAHRAAEGLVRARGEEQRRAAGRVLSPPSLLRLIGHPRVDGDPEKKPASADFFIGTLRASSSTLNYGGHGSTEGHGETL